MKVYDKVSEKEYTVYHTEMLHYKNGTPPPWAAQFSVYDKEDDKWRVLPSDQCTPIE